MNSLKISNLNYKYKNFEALSDISFEINDGLIGVLGANGAGKTTTMKLITTLNSIQNGEIFLNDLNYKTDLKEVRKKIGYLPQDFSTYGNLKGIEFLEVIADLKLEDNKVSSKEHINEIVEKLGMKDYINRKIKEYSGGMKQKLGFAQVLIGNPSLVILDEPTVGLDPEQRNNIRELFPIISKNRIVLVTTHIVEDIEYYCNYLLVLKNGRLIFKGNKEEFIKKAEGMVWEADVDKETFIKISTSNKTLTSFKDEECFKMRYISDKPLTNNSAKSAINLQDAYIVHNNIAER